MNNTTKEGTVHLGALELSYILGRLIRGYKFLNKNTLPTLIIVARLEEVDGVRVQYGEEIVKPDRKGRRQGAETPGDTVG